MQKLKLAIVSILIGLGLFQIGRWLQIAAIVIISATVFIAFASVFVYFLTHSNL